MLDIVGGLGVLSGYPGYGIRVSQDWAEASRLDADLIVLGRLPDALRGSDDLSLIIENQRSTLLSGRAPAKQLATDARLGRLASDPPANRIAVTAQAPFAAIVGMQSPSHPQRSIIAFAAANPADHALIDDALSDIGKRAAISGSVAILRTSGVSSQFVGKHYYVGNLPWWTSLWYRFADYPWLFVAFAALAVAMLAFLLWQGLRRVAARRLNPGD